MIDAMRIVLTLGSFLVFRQTLNRIYLDDKELLRGFRVRVWVNNLLVQIVDKVVQSCESPQSGDNERKRDARAERVVEDGHESEDQLQAAVREETAEMALTLKTMGWEAPLAFGSTAKMRMNRRKSKKRSRVDMSGSEENGRVEGRDGAVGGALSSKHVRFDEDGRRITTGSPSSLFFPADGKDEEPEACAMPPQSSLPSGAASTSVRAPPPKYWMQRFRFFSQFDLGCRLDDEGWFSITPERIARHIAERARSDLVVDLFVGCGGNAIQFALSSHYVLAIDIDPHKLAIARHNARVYGVDDRIEFILGDALTLLPRLGTVADVLFLSPPWGGPEYLASPTYSLKQIRLEGGVSGHELFERVLSASPNVAALLPRNMDLRELAEAAGGRPCEVEENILNYKLKTLTVYFGHFFFPAPLSDWSLKKQKQRGGHGSKGGKKKRKKRPADTSAVSLTTE